VEAERTNDPRAGEIVLASACSFLKDGGREDLARLLATCALHVDYTITQGFAGAEWQSVDLAFTAPHAAYEVLTPDEDSFGRAVDESDYAVVRRAIEAVVPPPISVGAWHVRAALIDPPEDWRSEYGVQSPAQSAFGEPRAIETPAPSDNEILF
jgi:hypothetical protein